MRTLALIWRSAGLLMATAAESVVEVLPPVSCGPVPAAPAWVRGAFAYRGERIPLVDAAALLGGSSAPDRMVNRVLILRIASAESLESRTIGLWVESVLELERIDFDIAEGQQAVDSGGARTLGSAVQTRWGQVQVVGAADLFTAEQILALTLGLGEAAA